MGVRMPKVELEYEILIADENPAKFRRGCEITKMAGLWNFCYCKFLDLHSFPCFRKTIKPCKKKNEHKNSK